MFGFLNKFFSSFSCDMAIDLGTANTLIYIKGHGIVLNEPSVVAVSYNNSEKKVFAIGREAKAMIGRTPIGTKTIRPLKDGVIADFDIAGIMIRSFIQQVTKNSSFLMSRPNILICVPSGATQVERRAIKEAAEASGAGSVKLIQEPIAAAVGANVPVKSAVGSTIVDIGGGTTEIAILALGGIVYATSLKVGGDKMDAMIINYIRRNHNLLIGESTAEMIKITIGSAVKMSKSEEKTMSIRGRDIINGIPIEAIISESQVAEAISEAISSITAALIVAMEYVGPELGSDIASTGIILTGGGALLNGLSQAIEQKIGLPVHVAEDPKCCVVNGTGKCLEDVEYYAGMMENE